MVLNLRLTLRPTLVFVFLAPTWVPSLFVPSFPPLLDALLALPIEGKDIVFIIEYSSSLMDFGSWVIGLFLFEDF
jgi:hypothetical protein